MSPGVPLDKPGLLAAAKQGIPFTNEIELGYLSARGPILAITGSNGKTTVTSLDVYKRQTFDRVQEAGTLFHLEDEEGRDCLLYTSRCV